MSNPFLGEIKIVSFTFAPKGWAECNGQLLPISQNTALFSLLGTMYGGNGVQTFALPDLQGRCAVSPGAVHTIGERAGASSVTLQPSEMPAHSHALSASAAQGTSTNPAGTVFAQPAVVTPFAKLYGTSGNASMSAPVLPSGQNDAHDNMMPSLVLRFCIALQGIFPSRS
ncbi:MAG TPA: tail fiber protein [Capsulimonadaceae bacterium]|jgi:microcystin-dependent protein